MEFFVKSNPILRVKAGRIIWRWELQSRIKRNPVRIAFVFIVVIVLFILISPIIGIIGIVIILSVVLLDYRSTMKAFANSALEQYSLFPDGYIIRCNNDGFANVSVGNTRTKLNYWSQYCGNNGFFVDIEEYGVFAIYQRKFKHYHLFFREEMKEDEYFTFVKFAKRKLSC